MADKEQDDLNAKKLLLEECRLQYQHVYNIKNSLEGKSNNLLALISIIQGIVSAILSLSLVKLENLQSKEVMGLIVGIQILATIISIIFYLHVVSIKKYKSAYPQTNETKNNYINYETKESSFVTNKSILETFLNSYNDAIIWNKELNEKKATSVQMMLIFFIVSVLCLSLFICYILINIIHPNILNFF